jgi:hypothetical protein
LRGNPFSTGLADSTGRFCLCNCQLGGKIPDTSIIMSPVAHSLNKSQIEAVAAYVSTLK